MKSNTFFTDLKSGIVVFLVALPLCLGIALACGAPLYSGIIAGVIGGLIITSISNAKFSVSGPAAGLTAVVLSATATLGSFETFLAAVVFAGIIQVVFGILKAGSISNFIPNSVIKGMLAGIGIILIIKQLPHFVGYDADFEGDINFEQPDGHNTITDLYYMLNYINPGSIAIGFVSLIIILVAETRKYKENAYLKYLPGPLVAVIAGILLTVAFSNSEYFKITSEHLVNLPEINSFGDVKSILLYPDFSRIYTGSFWTVVFTLAIVASLETLLNIEAIEKLDPERIPVNSNRELLAQGVGNTLSGLIGGLPITSVIVRSSANINSGAKTKLSVIVHAVLLLVCVLLIPGVLSLIPNSTLAVILIITGYKLANIATFKYQYERGLDQFLPFIVTIVVMLLTDLLKGVSAGLVVAVIFIIRINMRSTIEIIEEVIDGKTIYLIKLPQHLTFFNKGYMVKYLNEIKDDSSIIIDGSINRSTDKDVKEVMLDFISSSKKRNIEVQLVKYKLTNEY